MTEDSGASGERSAGGISFDASHFLEVFLGSEDLTSCMHELLRDGNKLYFIVPGHGGAEWMRDAPTLSSYFEHICFRGEGQEQETGRGKEQQNPVAMRSLSGIPARITEDAVKVDAHPAASGEGSEILDGQEYRIASRFSIDSDGIVAQVYVVETDADTIRGLAGKPFVKPASSVDSLMFSSELPWREALLLKLREPEAAPIVKEIKRIIKYLSLDEVSSQLKSDVTQQFYGDLRLLLQKNHAWESAPKEEIDGSMNAIEKYVFSKCNVFVYQANDLDDVLQDRLFGEKAVSLAKLSMSSLVGFLDSDGSGEDEATGRRHQQDEKVDASASESESANGSEGESESEGESGSVGDTKGHHVKEAVCWLKKCSKVDSPIEKLDALIGFVKTCAVNFGGGGSADLLIPTMVRLVIQNVPKSLISDVRYIQRYRNHGRLMGEAAYCLTNVVAVITMIEKLYGEQVSKSDPIYSLLASREDLRPNQMMHPAEASKQQPLSELNSMASSFINTIGFVPRAIGSAVADTFRSRTASKSISGANTADTSAKDATIAGSSGAGLGRLPDEEVSREVKDLRRMLGAAPRGNKQVMDSLTLRQVHLIIEDYQCLLATHV